MLPNPALSSNGMVRSQYKNVRPKVFCSIRQGPIERSLPFSRMILPVQRSRRSLPIRSNTFTIEVFHPVAKLKEVFTRS
jgi:hypothetical protein